MTIGRVGVDLYPEQAGVRLREVERFVRLLGGSYDTWNAEAEAYSPIGSGQLGMSFSHARTDGYREHSRAVTTRARAFGRHPWGEALVQWTAAVVHQPVAENPGALTAAEAADAPRQAQARNVATSAGKASTQAQAGLTLLRDTPLGLLDVTGWALYRDLDNPLSFAYIALDRWAGGLRFTLTREGDRGSIYLKNGQMVHATVGDLTGEEAIYALAIWNSGEFQFNAGEEPDRQTISKSNTNLLMEAARRLDEWRVLSKKIPSVEYVPELMARENRHEQVTLSPHEWMLLTKIDGRHSITEIGRALNMSSFDVAKILYGMITGELVHLKKKSDRNADEENGELVDLAARIRAVAEEYIGDSAHKTIEKHFLHALDGIMSGNGSEAVYVVEEDRAVRRTVSTGLTSQGRVEVVAGLRPGERVITRGNTMLRDGMSVRVIDGAVGERAD